MAVPFFDVLVANWPIHRKAITGRAFKVKVRPALYLSRPHEGLASHLVASDPVKGLFLHIGMLCVLDKEVHGIFSEGIALADDRVFLLNLFGKLPPMGKLMRKHGGGRVVFDVLDIGTTLDHQGFYPKVTEFLRCPCTADAGANHDGLIGSFLCAF